MAPAASALTAVGEQSWRGLRLVNAYRAMLAFALVVAAVSGRGPQVFGQQDVYLFGFAAWGYLFLVVLFEFLLELRMVDFRPQAHLHALGDLLILFLIMHASGGPGGGIALLLIISVALTTILLGGRTGLGYASLATLMVLGEAGWSVMVEHGERHFAAAGLLGVALFTITGLVVSVERRALRFQRLNVHHERELAHLSSLAVQIIEQFEEGVLISDRDGRVEYINSAARSLLDDAGPASVNLDESCPPLSKALGAWCRRHGEPGEDLTLPGRFRARFQRLDSVLGQRALILLTDLRAEDARLQQRKLAALGRLTASIAHEVRNPLSSIRQATELLDGTTSETERAELQAIILKHTDRINHLVRSVLDASRRPQVNPVDIPLAAWLDEFMAAQPLLAGGEQSQIAWRIEAPDIPEVQSVRVWFDTAHLWQIMDNLVANALRHGADEDGHVQLTLRWQLAGPDLVRILVYDHGRGIDDEARSQLFEPFFTTHAQGVGLGLYISRELAEANQAKLDIEPPQADVSGTCFRLDVRRGHTEPDRPDRADESS